MIRFQGKSVVGVREKIPIKYIDLIKDVYSSCRFDGAAPEPRKGIRSGHVPGSKCIPFAQVEDNLL